MNGKVLILIPTLNEEFGIGKVIDGIPVNRLRDKGLDVNVVIVDGNSIDRTIHIAEEKKASVYLQSGRGKGNGVRQAFNLSMKENVQREIKLLRAFSNADYIIMIDGDGTYPTEKIVDFIDLLSNGSDVVMGSRLKGERDPGAMSRLNYFGNTMISFMASVLYFHPVSDVCTGLWGFKRDSLKQLYLNSESFELEAELFAESVKHHFKITELPIDYHCREGETKLLPIKSGFAIVLKLFKRRLYNPPGQTLNIHQDNTIRVIQ